jgi:hypothetical protein
VLFQPGDIVEHGEAAEAASEDSDGSASGPSAGGPDGAGSLGIGSLRGVGR